MTQERRSMKKITIGNLFRGKKLEWFADKPCRSKFCINIQFGNGSLCLEVKSLGSVLEKIESMLHGSK